MFNNLHHKYTRLSQQFVESLNIPAIHNLFNYRQTDQQRFHDEVRRMFPNNSHLSRELLTTDINKFISESNSELMYEADKTESQVITPWTIEMVKKQGEVNVVDFLGPVRKQLPVVVIVDNNQRYMHYFSEEFMFGILSVVETSGRFTFYLKDIIDNISEPLPITLNDIIDNYVMEERYEKYEATTTLGKITFNTVDLIQGIITGASWLNLDPHNYITNIIDQGNRNTHVTF